MTHAELTTDDLAKVLGRSPSTITRMVRERRLTPSGSDPGRGRGFRFNPDTMWPEHEGGRGEERE